MNIEFAISPEAVLTVAGSALFAALVSQWLKQFLADRAWTPLVVLGITEAVCLTAQWVAVDALSKRAVFESVMMGFVAATLAVFGYEVVASILGKLGLGPKSPAALESKARAQLEKVGYIVTESVAQRSAELYADQPLPPR